MNMPHARQQPTETEPRSGGIVRDLSQLKSDGAASVAELREFLKETKGKSPQEMLGRIAKSGLTRSIVLATFLLAVLLAALTLIPYVLQGRDAASAHTRTAEPLAAETTAASTDDVTPKPDAAAAATVEQTNDAKPDPDRVLDVLGIGETRTAEPDKNPLEDKLDNLLDGVE